MAAPLTRARPMVVKIGGSLAGSPHLVDWLQALEAAPPPLVVVPGGGAFAAAVRTAQAELRFDDAAAHHMALLAMEQYGIALAALSVRLILASTPAAIQRAWRTGMVPFWAPAHMALEAALPPVWDLTSDSLAAWLAATLRADRLLLIKSVEVGAAPVAASDLASGGIVDAMFPRFAAMSGAEAFIAGPSALAGAPARFAENVTPGVRILLP